MICRLCGTDKLSEEFPHQHLTEECTKHPLQDCLRCVTASVRNHNKCSRCHVKVTKNNEQYKEHIETLEFLFPTVVDSGEEVKTANQSLGRIADDSKPYAINVTTLSGEGVSFKYDRNLTIKAIKAFVEKMLQTPHRKQCLLFKDTELQEKRKNGTDLKLRDYGIQPNSTIFLLVLLYEVPEDLSHVVFDFSWKFPENDKDFLDASVFLYKGIQCIDVVDFQARKSKHCRGVEHTGDSVENEKQLGHQTIKISIKSLPSIIDRLVFTLSAWRYPTVSSYPQPNLKFYDERSPNKQLCDDKMDDVANSQAIVVCFLARRNEKWRVISVKRPSLGNAENYNPLKDTIDKLIRLEG